MKQIIAAALLLASSSSVLAIPIYNPPAPAGMVFDHWETQRYWTIHGKDRKYVPVFVAAAPVPEPETYGMLLAGMGLVAWRVRRKVE